MDLEIRKEDAIIFVKLSNENARLDASTSMLFKGKIIDLIEQGNKFFIFNFTHVDFIDSSVLAALISILKTLTNSKGNMVLCEVKTYVFNLFSITRMDKVFPIFKNENEAQLFFKNLVINGGSP